MLELKVEAFYLKLLQGRTTISIDNNIFGVLIAVLELLCYKGK
jgi:hypothetical protein